MAVDAPSDPTERRWTIDALAAESGLTRRNIRALQTEGLLHGPRIEGRTGFYDRTHLDRLAVIARLQTEGFSRASIATLLHAWDSGSGLAEVLGIGGDLPGILTADRHLRTSLDSFRERMGGDDEAIADVVEMRLARIEGDEVEILNPALFDIGRELALAGFSLHAILQHAHRLRDAADNIAEHYIDEIRAQWRDNETPDEQGAKDLTAMLLRLSPLVTRSVDAALRQSMNNHLHRVLDEVRERALVDEDPRASTVTDPWPTAP